MEFFKAGGEERVGRSFSKFPRRGSLPAVDNDSRSLAFSSRRIERLKNRRSFLLDIRRWNIDAEDQRRSKKTIAKHVSVPLDGTLEAG